MDIKDITVGMRVRYTNKDMHKRHPKFYPKPSTVGEVWKTKDDDNGFEALVQWPAGTTSIDDYWWCDAADIEPAGEE